MKKSIEFVKTTALGGLVALVPLGVLVAMVASVAPVLVEIAGVLGEFLPFGPLTNMLIAALGGLALLVAICFLAGLALLSGPGDALRRRVDQLFEKIIPLYGAARRLAERVTGAEGEDFWPVAVDLHGSGARSLGVLVERIPAEGGERNAPGERCAVFVPLAPTAAFGNVYIVPAGQVERIEAPLPDVLGAVTEWGVGAARLFRDQRRTN
ncbi:MAG: DUF502 domain-containing protein [bacterium]|nr:DUF502 domain-containing protein [bacterium]